MSAPPEPAPEDEDRIAARVIEQLRPLLERTGEEERESLKDAQWTRRQRRRCDRWEALIADGIARPALTVITVGLLGWLGWAIVESMRSAVQ